MIARSAADSGNPGNNTGVLLHQSPAYPSLLMRAPAVPPPKTATELGTEQTQNGPKDRNTQQEITVNLERVVNERRTLDQRQQKHDELQDEVCERAHRCSLAKPSGDFDQVRVRQADHFRIVVAEQVDVPQHPESQCSLQRHHRLLFKV
jgi:hypothetical protein